jgi:hypothetical protein
MSTTISAGNTTNGMAFSADDTGILELKTGSGSGTTAVTIDDSQNATFAGTITQPLGTTYPIVSRTATLLTGASLTSVPFTSIPSWVKRITVMFYDVSTSGTSNIQLEIGTGSGPTYSTGFIGTAATFAGAVTAFTDGLLLTTATTAAMSFNGTAVLTYMGATSSAHTWTGVSDMGRADAAGGTNSAGTAAFSSALTAIRITTINGTDTFDTGYINIFYE